jgi:hypothetical protein
MTAALGVWACGRDAAELSLRGSLQGLGLLRLQPGGTRLPRKAGLPVEALQLDDVR